MDAAVACSTSLLDVPEIDSCCAAADVTIEFSKCEPYAPLLHHILTEADAAAATATFSLLEWNLFYEVFCGCDDRVNSISAVIEHRHALLDQDDDDGEDADAAEQQN